MILPPRGQTDAVVGYGSIRMTFGETSASVSLVTVFISNNKQIATVGSTTASQAELIIIGVTERKSRRDNSYIRQMSVVGGIELFSCLKTTRTTK